MKATLLIAAMLFSAATVLAVVADWLGITTIISYALDLLVLWVVVDLIKNKEEKCE